VDDAYSKKRNFDFVLKPEPKIFRF